MSDFSDLMDMKPLQIPIPDDTKEEFTTDIEDLKTEEPIVDQNEAREDQTIEDLIGEDHSDIAYIDLDDIKVDLLDEEEENIPIVENKRIRSESRSETVKTKLSEYTTELDLEKKARRRSSMSLRDIEKINERLFEQTNSFN